MLRRAFTAVFKLSVSRFADEFGNCAVGCHFRVDESVAQRWCSNEATIKLMPKKAVRGNKAQWPELEERLFGWVKRMPGLAVLILTLRIEAKITKYIGIRDFCSSEKTKRFQQFIINLRKRHQYSLSHIGSADQTSLTFDLPMGRRLEIIMTGELPLYIVFKRKALLKDVKFLEGLIVRAQMKGYMDQALIVDWLRIVWGPSRALLRGLDGQCSEGDDKDQVHKKKKKTWTIFEWILKIWEEIPENIKWAFLKCCISNALDGTDDILWEDDALSPDYSHFSDDKDELAYVDDQLCEVFNGSSDDEELLGFE
uniref:DDE-1 domain-containing protein n=1 Tax=Octopus bimaculoides TaxID=37653 RepID=A0A0L8I7T2_OCTBM